MSILVRRYLGRSRYVEELVEDWQIAYQKAQLAWDLQDLVAECIELGQFAKRTWDFLADKLFDESVAFDHDSVGESMSIALKKTLQIFIKVQRLIKRLHQLDCPSVDNATEFEELVAQTKQANREFQEQWPGFDTDTVEEALAAYGRGDYDTSEALLNDAKNHNPQTE